MNAEQEYLVATAQAGVEAAQRKVDKAKVDLEDAKESLAVAKDDLRAAKSRKSDLASTSDAGDTDDVEAHAETAEIKSE